jgi:4-amino-4-deoxy-L-arabinose transferase-like glycosyltransferase
MADADTSSLSTGEEPSPRLGLQLLLVALYAALVFLPWLGQRTTWTPGEARVAQTARQMLAGEGAMRFGGAGDWRGWVVPKLGHELRLEKPPLSYWTVAAAAWATGQGVNDFTSRLPSVLAALLACLLVTAWGREAVGGWGGLLAGVALASTASFWWQARTCTIEMTHLACILAALYAWWRYHTSRAPDGERQAGWLLFAYAAAGLGALDKGIIAPPLVLLIVLFYLRSLVPALDLRRAEAVLFAVLVLLWLNVPFLRLPEGGPLLEGEAYGHVELASQLLPALFIVYYVVSRRRHLAAPLAGFRPLRHLAGLGVFLALVLGWAVPVTLLVGRNDAGEWTTLQTWLFQADRLEGFDHIKGWWYFAGKILGDGQPWVFFALVGLAAWLWLPQRRRNAATQETAGAAGRRPDSAMRFVAVWAVVTFVFFSIPNSKKSYYILPLYPAFALLAAWCLERLRDGTLAEDWPARLLARLCQGVGGLLVLLGLALPFVKPALVDTAEKFAKYAGHAPETAATAGLAVLGGMLVVWWGRRRCWRGLAVTVAGLAVLGFGVHTWLLPALNAHKGELALVRIIRPRLRSDDQVCTYGFSGQDIFCYYLNRDVDRLHNPAALVRRLAEHADGPGLVLVTERRDWDRFGPSLWVRGEGAAAWTELRAFVRARRAADRPVRLYGRLGEPAGAWQALLRPAAGVPDAADPPAARQAYAAAVERFLAAGLELQQVLHAHGGRVAPLAGLFRAPRGAPVINDRFWLLWRPDRKPAAPPH